EDGIRDKLVTGVQTCALPICAAARKDASAPARAQQPPARDRPGVGGGARGHGPAPADQQAGDPVRGYHPAGSRLALTDALVTSRSEERRVGKECRSRWTAYQ